MHRRAFLIGSAVALSPLILPASAAHATTARIVTLEELLSYSRYVVTATAGAGRATWEELPSGRRIVTYTPITIDRAIVGEPGASLVVRTLGGVVDRIGQSVGGEAQLAQGSRAMLFLASTQSSQSANAVVVAAMAQGHFPLVRDASGVERLTASPESPMLVGRPGPMISARDRLLGATVDDAVATVKLVSGGGK